MGNNSLLVTDRFRRAGFLLFILLCCLVYVIQFSDEQYQNWATSANTTSPVEPVTEAPEPIRNVTETNDKNSVKIVIWAPNPPARGTLKRIHKVVDELNQNSGEYCKNQYGKGNAEWDNLNCQFTLDEKALREADAVSFYMFNMGYNALPQTRTSNQIWIIFVQEAPVHSYWVDRLEWRIRDPLQNLFNWTMSYRTDLEIWNPYGRKIKLEKPMKPGKPIMIGKVTLDKWIAGKTKLVAGAISHCDTPSKREDLIEKMNQSSGGQVDVFGGCGNKKAVCTLESNYNQKCGDFWEIMAEQYKFFLAFENALCREYVTEKFWRTLEVGMVPVVYGGGFYSADAPPNSYIDARDFNSATDLVHYLQRLANNKTEYAKYFEWRRECNVEQKWSWGYCNLCKAIRDHNAGTRERNNVYPNLKYWWDHQPRQELSACDDAKMFDV